MLLSAVSLLSLTPSYHKARTTPHNTPGGSCQKRGKLWRMVAWINTTCIRCEHSSFNVHLLIASLQNEASPCCSSCCKTVVCADPHHTERCCVCMGEVCRLYKALMGVHSPRYCATPTRLGIAEKRRELRTGGGALASLGAVPYLYEFRF